MDENKEPGRPTKYKPEYNQQMIDFFNRVPYTKEKLIITKKNGDTEEKWIETPCDFPLISAFANEIGVSRDTLHEWANAKDDKGELKHPEFSDTYKKAKQYQETIMVTNGLRGLYQPVFSIFTAKNVIDYRDRQEITGKDGEPITPSTVNVVIKGSKSKLMEKE